MVLITYLEILIVDVAIYWGTDVCDFRPERFSHAAGECKAHALASPSIWTRTPSEDSAESDDEKEERVSRGQKGSPLKNRPAKGQIVRLLFIPDDLSSELT